ncbi:hypothetical protein HDV63DRAFT_214608 [Trichoderma sp. SZMC 28014]
MRWHQDKNSSYSGISLLPIEISREIVLYRDLLLGMHGNWLGFLLLSRRFRHSLLFFSSSSFLSSSSSLYGRQSGSQTSLLLYPYLLQTLSHLFYRSLSSLEERCLPIQRRTCPRTTLPVGSRLISLQDKMNIPKLKADQVMDCLHLPQGNARGV